MTVSTLSAKRVAARKPHRCVWCGHEVLAGSQYERQEIVIDGDFQSNAWHEACLSGFDAFWQETRENEFEPGEQEMPFLGLYQLEVGTPSPQSTVRCLREALESIANPATVAGMHDKDRAGKLQQIALTATEGSENG